MWFKSLRTSYKIYLVKYKQALNSQQKKFIEIDSINFYCINDE